MNIKKLVLTLTAILSSFWALAYPTVQQEDPSTQLLQQYTLQMQELQKKFDQKLLPTLKNIVSFVQQVQQDNQEELSEPQEALFEKYMRELDKGLTDLISPALKDFNLTQFNTQYQQMAASAGLPVKELTQQEVYDLLKSMYLIAALGHFEQTKKLSEDELIILMEIFFPEQEEE